MILEAMSYHKPQLIALPETFNFRGAGIAAAEEFDKSESLEFLQILAMKHQISIMTGSHLVIKHKDQKPFNSSFYINSSGEIIANYSKVHLFDVQIQSQPSFEAANCSSGVIDELDVYNVVAQSQSAKPSEPRSANLCEQSADMHHKKMRNNPDGNLQISINFNFATAICYDLRFPELFRHYMFNCKLVPDIIFVPSAFGLETGAAHWETLVRARAIENSVFIVAPNQIGKSENGFDCYGNSMVVDPWGKVLVRGTTSSPQVLTVELDLAQIRDVRNKLPLSNRRLI